MSAPVSTVPELATASAGELARRIAAKEVTSREVVEALLGRIEALNPGLQSIRVVLAARTTGEALDPGTVAGFVDAVRTVLAAARP